MIPIVCIDDSGGMLFNHRRQSQDRLLRARVLEQTADGVLWMNAFSKKQFTEAAPQIRVDENFLQLAQPEDFCFVEDRPLAEHLPRIRRLILYRWNRAYPGDQFLDLDLTSWTQLSCTEFPGSSHDCITEEVYEK